MAQSIREGSVAVKSVKEVEKSHLSHDMLGGVVREDRQVLAVGDL